MPISKERFAQGLTGQQFIDVIDKNRERFEQNFAETPAIFTDEDRAFFAEHPVSIAAIGEDWCTDVVQFLPPIIKLAEEVPSITLRIFLRDQNLDLMDQYLKEGEFRSIPTFVIYDADWNELGHFNERPAAVTQEMAKETRRYALENSDLEGINRTVENMPSETQAKIRANSARFRWDSMLAWNRIFLDEIKAIAGGAKVGA
ncbi:MAG TPA: thioredoxin family protein [Nitrolancea sp.]|nr:thioredoxin family protein [Nitrolancea sp.]